MSPFVAEPLCCLLHPESYFLLDCDDHSGAGGGWGNTRISGDEGQRVVDKKKRQTRGKGSCRRRKEVEAGKKRGRRLKLKG